ncbi:MAG: VOC family protein [Candidatus Promineifilaceae bacterium]|nr:VOC family protein [Candidatus Promineifilaceae bacterium]
MNHSFKPDGYNSVSPYLVVDGTATTIEFLKQVFGAELLRSFPGDNGRLMHAEVRLDDTVLMLADSIDDWPSQPAHVHVYVQNVDAVYRRALDADALPVKEPEQGEDEDRRGGVKDAGGTTWWIATRVG